MLEELTLGVDPASIGRRHTRCRPWLQQVWVETVVNAAPQLANDCHLLQVAVNTRAVVELLLAVLLVPSVVGLLPGISPVA